jgi:hypothetical protein
MKTRLGTPGGFERIILCTAPWSFYIAVKPFRRYYRLAMGLQILGGVYVGRS